MNIITDIPRFALELKDRKDAKPDLRIMVHHLYYPKNFKFVGMDLSLTNISNSSFSISTLFLNDVESILAPIISEPDEDGRRRLRSYLSEKRSPSRIIENKSVLPIIDPLPMSIYLKSNESIRGLVFWDLEIQKEKELEISTIILSNNKKVNANINLTDKLRKTYHSTKISK